MSLVLFDYGRKVLSSRQGVHDEDFTQTLFSQYTIVVLLVATIIITPGQYFGTPITCWHYMRNPGPTTDFIDRKCLIQGMYALPEDEYLESYPPHNSIRWYAFTPLIVLTLYLPFLMASLVWRTFNKFSGFNISRATEAARKTEQLSTTPATSKVIIHSIAKNIHAIKRHNPSPADITIYSTSRVSRWRYHCCNCYSTSSSSYLSNVLLTVKILNIVGAVLNICFIAAVIGHEYFTIGFEFMFKVTLHKPIVFPKIFPMTTICDISTLTDMVKDFRSRYPCVLNLMVFIEKIFVFLWFLHVFLIIIGVCDLVQYCIFNTSAVARYDFFSAYMPIPQNRTQRLAQLNFFKHHLASDCCNALRLMSNNLDNLTMSVLCSQVYELHTAESAKMKVNEGVEMQQEPDTSEQDLDGQIDKIENLTRKEQPAPLFDM